MQSDNLPICRGSVHRVFEPLELCVEHALKPLDAMTRIMWATRCCAIGGARISTIPIISVTTNVMTKVIIWGFCVHGITIEEPKFSVESLELYYSAIKLTRHDPTALWFPCVKYLLVPTFEITHA